MKIIVIQLKIAASDLEVKPGKYANVMALPTEKELKTEIKTRPHAVKRPS